MASTLQWDALGPSLRASSRADGDPCSNLSFCDTRGESVRERGEPRAVVPSICLTGAGAIAQYPEVEWVGGAGVSTNRRGDSEWYPPGVVAGVAGAELPGRRAPRMGSARCPCRHRVSVRRGRRRRQAARHECDRADPSQGAARRAGVAVAGAPCRSGAPGGGLLGSPGGVVSARARRAAARARAAPLTHRRAASRTRIDAVQTARGSKKVPSAAAATRVGQARRRRMR